VTPTLRHMHIFEKFKRAIEGQKARALETCFIFLKDCFK
jgi:hypothetical protein